MNPPTPQPQPHPSSAGRPPTPEIFPNIDFRFHLKLGRCPAAAFFGPWHPESGLLGQRRHWIQSAPEHHVLADDDALPALIELAEVASAWTTSPPGTPQPVDARALVASLGACLEPDFALLSRASGRPRLKAACVCFPSRWSPEEKLGATLEAIHEPVPGLEQALGESLDAFMRRIRPGPAWLRANWGLTASPELNQHPARNLPRCALPIDPRRAWLRIEHQALLVLPRTDWLLFGIRIEQRPLGDVVADRETAPGLARALRTMPEPLAVYKGIDSVRQAIADLLDPPTPVALV